MKLSRTMVVASLEDMCDLMCGKPEDDGNEHQYCLRCGRKLKSEESRELGYGTICYKKMLTKNKNIKSLF